MDEKEAHVYADDSLNKVHLFQDEFKDRLDFNSWEEYLLYSSRTGNYELVKELISQSHAGKISLDINCKGKQKSNHSWTPLHLACYFGHFNMVKLLLENHAKINVINDNGDTPLHKAAYVGNLDIVTYLVSNHADVLITNAEGKCAKDISKSDEVITLLLAAEKSDMKKKEEKFLSAAREGNIEVLKELLNDNNPVNINCQDANGNSALHCASYRAQKEVIVFLLQNGIDSNLKNNKNQIAASLAPNHHIKEMLINVKPLDINFNIFSLFSQSKISRFDGPLFRKGKFIVRRNIWAVLERGTLMLFPSREHSLKSKTSCCKYLNGAIVEANERDSTSFVIYFSDNSKLSLSVPEGSNSILRRQKWISAIEGHISYRTQFLSRSIHIDDDDEDDSDPNEILNSNLIKKTVIDSQAHLAILEKHIRSFVNFVQEDIHSMENQSFNSLWPSLNFHLNLIMEAGEKISNSFNHCANILIKQDELRAEVSRCDKDRIRVLEELLRISAKEQHDFEQSVISTIPYHSPPRISNHASDTEIDEYFDAFDDNKTITDEDTEFCTLTENKDQKNNSSLQTGPRFEFR